MAESPAGPDPKEVERRKAELLAAARSEPGEPGSNAMTGVGIQFAVTLLVCIFAGQWLDARFHTAPWLLLLGMAVGAGTGFWSLVRVAQAQEQKRNNGKGKGG